MTALAILIGYVIIFALCFYLDRFIRSRREQKKDFTSLKTVTFGDESTVVANRVATICSILAIILIWGMFTNSKITPVHVPGPYTGTTEFTYTAQNAAGETDDAQVTVIVEKLEDGARPEATSVDEGDGFAKNDSYAMLAWSNELLKVQSNDVGGDEDDYKIIAINGTPIEANGDVKVDSGKVALTSKGTMNYTPKEGIQMKPLYLPSPEAVVGRFVDLIKNGYKGISLADHVGTSLMRVFVGFLLGSIVGIPIGYAMGLSGWARGWFDPIVEFMRPIPPLALIPLIIIWFGIDETGKIVLLFLAALWIMIIAARSGVAGVNIAKIRAAYSLGASKPQILRHVIIPNSLPEIFTGARVAMGVCWGTVVAAELVAAQKGVGVMITTASKFSQTDVVIVGIIIIGLIGFSIEVFIRWLEKRLVPWKGRS